MANHVYDVRYSFVLKKGKATTTFIDIRGNEVKYYSTFSKEELDMIITNDYFGLNVTDVEYFDKTYKYVGITLLNEN